MPDAHETASLRLGAVDAEPRVSRRRAWWANLRRRPTAWVGAVILALVVAMALVPQLFTATSPTSCSLEYSLHPARAGHPFGFDRQGCDVYARVVYGARASLVVGCATTVVVTAIGVFAGALAGYWSRFVDPVISRLTDIVFAIPLALAAIVVMQVFRDSRSILLVVAVISAFGWPQIARITRGAVLELKNSDYVRSARTLGMAEPAILLRHVLPNALGPILAYATMAAGTFIVLEATLSFMGIGLPPEIVSWGGDIAAAKASLRVRPLVLFYPSAALAATVLSFILLGDVARDMSGQRGRGRR